MKHKLLAHSEKSNVKSVKHVHKYINKRIIGMKCLVFEYSCPYRQIWGRRGYNLYFNSVCIFVNCELFIHL